MIRTESLCKYFYSDHREVKAVDGLNLQVNEGEVFGFLGPNGAGKTTTVRLLACLIGPTAGRAWVNGLEVGKDDTKIRSQVGILTESPGLYERLSARRNLEIFAALYGVKDIGGQVEKYLRLLDLWDRREAAAGTFSKGMKQKLAIARALLHEPPVLFLDEPTSALDPESAHTVRDFIETLRGQGRTVFLCTHNLDEAERLCDRIAVFRQRIIAVDTPEALRRQLFGRQTVVHVAPLTAARNAPLGGPGSPQVGAPEACRSMVWRPSSVGCLSSSRWTCCPLRGKRAASWSSAWTTRRRATRPSCRRWWRRARRSDLSTSSSTPWRMST